MSRKELTPDEIARVKRWAAMQDEPVHIQLFDDGDCLLAYLPAWVMENRYTFPSTDAAWSALALALRPVFASVAPVVREECIQILRRTPCYSDSAIPSITHAINEIENLK